MIKPRIYNTYLDINPFKTLKEMNYQNKIFDSLNLQINQNYIKQRQEFFIYLKSIITKSNFNDQSYYLACLYSDLIFSNQLFKNFLRKL